MRRAILMAILMALSTPAAAKNTEKECRKLKKAASKLSHEADLMANEDAQVGLRNLIALQETIGRLRSEPALDQKVIVEMERDLKNMAAKISKDFRIVLNPKRSSSFTAPAAAPLTTDKKFTLTGIVYVEMREHDAEHEVTGNVAEDLRTALLSNLDFLARPSSITRGMHQLPMTMYLEKLNADYYKLSTKCQEPALSQMAKDFSQYHQIENATREDRPAERVPSVSAPSESGPDPIPERVPVVAPSQADKIRQ